MRFGYHILYRILNIILFPHSLFIAQNMPIIREVVRFVNF